MSNLIDRQAAIEIADAIWTVTGDKNVAKVWQQLKDLPSAEPDVPDTNVGDMISRQAAIDALNSLVNRFEQILRDTRETNVDDSVCGMCEYDGAYIGQSGDWCNECPGFDKEDCFKLSDTCRKRWLESVDLISAQPEQKWIPCSDRFPEDEWVLISKKPTKLSGSKWCVNIAIRMTDPRSNKVQWRDTGFGIIPDDKILAWMPLPEPYREEGEK